MILYKVFNLSIILLNKATHDGKHRASGGVVRSKKMKDINREKLWAYLEKRFDELGDEYDKQMENARTAESDKMTAILHRMTNATAKRNLIIEIKNDILSGRFDA